MNVKIDISNVELQTKRLIIRAWRESDVQDFFAYASVDEVGQMAGWLPHKNLKESEEILNIFIQGKKTFALEYNDKVIGSLGIERYNDDLFPEFSEQKGREIGFVLSKDYWGQGLVPEAVNEVIRYLFEDLDLDFMLCGYFDWNQQSKKVQEKCGFKRYKTRQFETRSGKIENTIISILTKEDWLSHV